MRQRILAEAAVRFLRPSRAPLVVLLPYDWIPPASTTFFSGFDLDWIDLTSVDGRHRRRRGRGGLARRPRATRSARPQFELDAANFNAAGRPASRPARRSTDLLTLNDLVGGHGRGPGAGLDVVLRARPPRLAPGVDRPVAAAGSTTACRPGRGRAPPRAVTLSSINGSFPTSISNELDQPVTVSLSARVRRRQARRSRHAGEVDIPAKRQPDRPARRPAPTPPVSTT